MTTKREWNLNTSWFDIIRENEFNCYSIKLDKLTKHLPFLADAHKGKYDYTLADVRLRMDQFNLISERTGAVAKLMLYFSSSDWYKYTFTYEDIQKNPQLEGWIVKIDRLR